MTCIWFNHWFRTAYSLIELMKQGDDELYIIGSHMQADSPIRTVCDEWHVEHSAPAGEYVERCLDFCKAHSVDVFVPHRYMTEIAENKERFDAIGVKLLTDSAEKLRLFSDKAKAYALYKDDDRVNIPDHIPVTSADEFAEAYKALSSSYENLCVKFTKDEGGQSFRRIIADSDPFERLHHYSGASITYDDLMKALSVRESFDELIVMPYLDGSEISVDCLAADDGLIAIPRTKAPAHIEYIHNDERILDMTRAVLEKADLKYPCDVQFRYLDGKIYLLEVNTRMSGGLPMSCAATGINIPRLALQKLLGRPVSAKHGDITPVIVSNVELPVVVRGGSTGAAANVSKSS